jgi:hypothetical protein
MQGCSRTDRYLPVGRLWASLAELLSPTPNAASGGSRDATGSVRGRVACFEVRRFSLDCSAGWFAASAANALAPQGLHGVPEDASKAEATEPEGVASWD